MKPALLIIGYYHLADGFKTASNYLVKDFDVFFFPLLHYRDCGYNIQSELSRYINGECCEHYECGLREQQPPMSVVIFWNFSYFTVSHERLNLFISTKNAINHKTMILAYNWDPKPPTKPIEPIKMLFIRLLNAYITGDGREIKELRKRGEYNYVYCPSGFDPTVSLYQYDPKYECDVSLVCTNLYTDYELFPRKHVRVHRKELTDLLYQHRNEIRFHLYGPPSFAEMYPECYRGGPISYEECSKVFSNSRINLCLHATSHNNYHKYIYFSERLPQIMGAHGLVYCETEYRYILKPDVNYILADSNDPIKQITEIIQDYQNPKYQEIKERGHMVACQALTWDNLRQTVLMLYHRFF
jgi:hypothetical protein